MMFIKKFSEEVQVFKNQKKDRNNRLPYPVINRENGRTNYFRMYPNPQQGIPKGRRDNASTRLYCGCPVPVMDIWFHSHYCCGFLRRHCSERYAHASNIQDQKTFTLKYCLLARCGTLHDSTVHGVFTRVKINSIQSIH